MDELHLLDLAALIAPLPSYNLRRGEIGVIIDVWPNENYLLEFVGKNGIPYAMPTVSAAQLMKVYLQADIVE